MTDKSTSPAKRNGDGQPSLAPATLLGITDLTHKAINALRDAAPDGRATWVTGHITPNADGTVTVAFRHKIGGKTATFKVNNETEAKLCCKIMRKETRGS
jgi:hypothetical protein